MQASTPMTVLLGPVMLKPKWPPDKPQRKFLFFDKRSSIQKQDQALAAYLEWERQDFEEAVRGIQRGYNDAKSGRTRSVEEFLNDMQNKHGLSR